MKKKKIAVIVCVILAVAVAAVALIPVLSEEKVPEGMERVWLIESGKDKTGVGKGYEYDAEGNLTAKLGYIDKEPSQRYNYDKNGNITQEIYYSSEGEIQQQTDFIYDENGKLTMETYSFQDGNYWENKYFYDDNGLLIKATSTQPEVEGATVYEYNSEGKLILFYEESNAEEKTEYTYDEKGNLIKEALVINGKEYSRYEYKYDGEDRLLEKSAFDNGAFDYRKVIKYDAEGRIIKEKYNYSEEYGENANREIIYTYDENGRKISIEEITSEGSDVIKLIYDEQGRLSDIDYESGMLSFDVKCKYTSVIVTPEQAEKIKTQQAEIIDELI